MSVSSDDEPDMFNDSVNSNVSQAAAVDVAAAAPPVVDGEAVAAAAVVEVVQVVLAGESRRSRRQLQAQLRNLAGGLNATGSLPLSGQPMAAAAGPEPIVIDDNESELSAFLAVADQVADSGPIVLDTSTSSATSTTSAIRKRRRVNSASTTPSPPKPKQLNEDDDDGSTCPICLDSWEMSGEHRLTALKCGHLFGESCIRRWFAGMATTARCCPSCKSKSNLRDIRSIYAKRVSVVDKSEEYRLQKLLDEEIVKVGTLHQEVALLKLELELQRKFNAKLESQLEQTRLNAINLNASLMSASQQNQQYQVTNAGGGGHAPNALRTYKLVREAIINVCPDPGCRVLIHSRRSNSLIVSQKSVQQLFPGFGVRFVDLPSYRATSFLHMAAKQIRDLAFDHEEQLLVAASMDRVCKLYNVNNRGCAATITPGDKPIWSVAFDGGCRSRSIYLGSQHGSTYAYDMRHPGTCVAEYLTCGDMSPVISISAVRPHAPEFPNGGILVCKLQSLWFYEFTSTAATVTATKLALSGPFVSMSYTDDNRTVLVVTRPTAAQPTSQLIYAELRKVEQTTTVYVITTMLGSRVQAVMSRCAQLRVDDTTLVTAYMQDNKELQTWQVRAAQYQNVRQHAVRIEECVLDSCPIYGMGGEQQVHLGALTETKCRIYKVQSDRA